VEAGTPVTVRDTRGSDATAACGQLRAALRPRRQIRPDGTLGPTRRWAPAPAAPAVDPESTAATAGMGELLSATRERP
jgi:hypothetical protein